MEEKILSGSLENNLTWRRDGNTLYIEGTGEMEPLDPCDVFPLSDYWENIQTVIIREGITFIDFSAFDNSLTSISIPASISYIDPYHLSYCHNLQQIIVSEGNQNYSSVDGILYSKDGYELVCMPQTYGNSYSIPETVVSIGAYAFSGCIGLTEITIPEGVISIGNCAFEDCTGLTRIILPESVGFIGEGAFARCTGITEMTIPSGITSINISTFCNCTGLTKILLPESVVSIVGDAFAGCSSLTSINLPVGITAIGNNAFLRCTSLKNILFPDTLTSIGDYAFHECIELTEIIIPSSVTDLGEGAFHGCYGLDKVIIQDGGAFRNNAFPRWIDVYCKRGEKNIPYERYDENDDCNCLTSAPSKHIFLTHTLSNEESVKTKFSCNWDWVGGFTSELSVVKAGKKWGVIDQRGNVVIPFEWDAMSSFHRLPFHHRSYAAVLKDGLIGLIDEQGNLLIPCRWKAIGRHYDFDWIVVCDNTDEDYYQWRWWHYNLETDEVLEWMYNGDDYRGENDAIDPFLIAD